MKKKIHCRIALSFFYSGIFLILTNTIFGGTMLPQKHEYQKVLRSYLSGFGVNDFTVKLDPVEFTQPAALSDDDLYKLWILFGPWTNSQDSSPDGLPSVSGITMKAENFLLSSIEGKEYIALSHSLADERKGISCAPGDTAWWFQWNYKGNPYFNLPALRNRAFTAAAVDVIMLDELQESGTHWVDNAHRSDFLGGTMIIQAYVYYAVIKDLPEPVKAAYEYALSKFVDRLTEWGPTCVNDNMDLKTVYALTYLIRAIRSEKKQTPEREKLISSAETYIKRTVKRTIHPSGIIRDFTGIEASYSGIAIQYLVKAVNASRDPFLKEALDRMIALKSSMTLVEPDGYYVGPSHFSLRTSSCFPQDQHVGAQREIGAAMETEKALYLMTGMRRSENTLWAAPDRDEMINNIKNGVAQVNNLLKPSDAIMEKWKQNHWHRTVNNTAHDYYIPGFYRSLKEMYKKNDEKLLPPFAQKNLTFIRSFPESDFPDCSEEDKSTFIIVKYSGYGAVFDAALLCHSDASGLRGFSGGALSAFWTPDGGSFILGRTHGLSKWNKWEDWRKWPVHALSGTTPDGNVFTSARLRRNNNTGEVRTLRGSNSIKVEIHGPIGVDFDNSETAQNGCIRGPAEYIRSFDFSSNGVTIETGIISEGSDQISEMYEIIPMFLGDTNAQKSVPHSVSWQVNGKWEKASEKNTPGITSIKIKRFAGETEIVFEKP